MLSSFVSVWLFAPAPTAVAPAPAPVVPVSTSEGNRMLVADRPRGRWAAGASFVVGGGALAGIVVMQVVRDRSYRECQRILAGPADEFLEDTFEGIGCGITKAAPGMNLGAMALAPLVVAMSATGGVALGRTHAKLGVQLSSEAIERRIRAGAIVLGLSAAVLLTANVGLWGAVNNRAHDATGLALQRTRFVVNDVAMVAASAGAAVLAHAHQYRRMAARIAVSPAISSTFQGLSISGRF